ncbi:MAG: S9 family peptidase [Acidobacteria bacterium]|nr:S9 family peptidase [Acidobacteriota bacterium]
MRKLIAAVLTFAASAAIGQTQHTMTFNDLMAIRRVGAPQVSPDGKWIAYDASTIDLPGNYRRSAIYLVPSTGGESKKISDGSRQDEGPVWSPDGRTIAWVSNQAGGAKQIWIYYVASGTTKTLPDLAGGASSLRWTPDGRALLAVSDVYPDCRLEADCVAGKKREQEAKPTQARVLDGLLYRHWKAWQEPTRSHVLLYTLDGTARDMTPGNQDAPPFSVGGGDEFDVSPDITEFVFARNTDEHPEGSTNSDLFITPVTTGKETITRITTRTGADTSPRYSPDGKFIAYRSQARAGYESDQWELWIYNRATKQSTRLAPTFPNWINSFVWAPDGKSIYVTAPEKSKNAIYEIAMDGSFNKLWDEASADALTVSKDGQTLYFERSSLTQPAEIWSLTKGGVAKQVTHDNDKLMASLKLGATGDVWYAGADNTQVQALTVKPPDFDASKKYPMLVLIHGGPQGAWSDAWSYRWNPQMFAAKGYVILMPNPRGSSGYGQKFVEEISRDWGGKVYADIMNGVDNLTAMPWVDGSRLGAAGGSYGGYMVDWILGHSDRFKALVSHAGVYNLESMYGVTEEVWFPEWELGGNPWDNPELYAKWSPNKFVKNFKTPTLVTHGELDFRVPINQGLELFTALQRRNVPSKMVYFPDEGHWILKPQNSKLWYEQVTAWFDQYVKK